MDAITQQNAQRRREAYQEALDAVRPYVPAIGAPAGFSAERVYQSALMQLGVDCSDLRYTVDVDGAYKARFQQWKAARQQAADVTEIKAGIRDVAEWQDAYNRIAEMTGESPSFPDDDGPEPTVADLYRESLQRLGVPVADDEPDEAMRFVWEAAMRAGGSAYGALASQVNRQTGQMGADSGIASTALESFAARFPNASAGRRRIF